MTYIDRTFLTERENIQMRNKRILTMVAIGFLFILLPGQQVDAAETRVIVNENGVVNCVNGDVVEKDCYVAVLQTGDGYQIVKPCTQDSKIYYFNKDGKGSVYKGTHFIAITYDGSQKTYYSKKGTLVTNQITGNKKEGYYYVDTTGVKITDTAVKYAVKFVRANTKTTDSKKTKLKKCYNYLWRHYKYSRIYASSTSRALNPEAADMKKIANEMFKSKRGNCHRYAACFAYIARVIGYDSKVAVGSISGRRGGMTPHGWAMVCYNKTGNEYQWYLCDPDMELNGVHVYMEAEHKCKTKTKWICTLTIKNGKVSWK